MTVHDLIIHDLVNTPDGKGRVMGCETLRTGPTTWDLRTVNVKVWFEPTKIYPRGIDRNYKVELLTPWVEPGSSSTNAPALAAR